VHTSDNTSGRVIVVVAVIVIVAWMTVRRTVKHVRHYEQAHDQEDKEESQEQVGVIPVTHDALQVKIILPEGVAGTRTTGVVIIDIVPLQDNGGNYGTD
jgi:hypothetical protein